MTPKLPIVKPQEAVKALQKAGFYIDHQSGSHLVLLNDSSKRRAIIPMHSRDVKKGILHSILKQAGLTIQEFINLL